MSFSPICPARAPPCDRNGLPEAISGVCEKFEKLVSGKLSSLLWETVVLLGNDTIARVEWGFLAGAAAAAAAMGLLAHGPLTGADVAVDAPPVPDGDTPHR